MVSRHVVDVIVIGGLILGTLGVLYLSYGLLGNMVHHALRRAVAAIVLTAVIASLSIYATIYLQASRPRGPAGPPWPWWLILLLSVLVVATLLTFYYMTTKEFAPVAKRLTSFPFTVTLVIECLVGGGILSLVFPHDRLFFLVVGIVAAVTYVVVFRILAATPDLSDPQLQIIGLIFTLLGITTQFVPPVLDLLGIKIV